MNLRTLRNGVIRHNFGLPGLRHWRGLNREKQALMRKINHYARIARTARSAAKRSAARAVIQDAQERIAQIKLQQLLLVQPELAQSKPQVTAAKAEKTQEKKPFWTGVVKTVKGWFGGDK